MKPDAIYDRGNPAIRFVLARLSDAAWNKLHARSAAGRWYLRGVHSRTWATLLAVWAVGFVCLVLYATLGIGRFGWPMTMLKMLGMVGLMGLPAAMVLICFALAAAMASARQMPGMIHDMMSGGKVGEDLAPADAREEVMALVRSMSGVPKEHADLVVVKPSLVRRRRYVIVDRMSNMLMAAGILCGVAVVIVTAIDPAMTDRFGPRVGVASGGFQIALIVWCLMRSRLDARVVERRVIEGKCCSCGYVIAEGVKGSNTCSECGWIRTVLRI